MFFVYTLTYQSLHIYCVTSHTNQVEEARREEEEGRGERGGIGGGIQDG